MISRFGCAVPAIETLAVPPGVPVTVIVASRLPVAVGAKVTTAVQLALGSSVVQLLDTE